MRRAVTGMLAITLSAGIGAYIHSPMIPLAARVQASSASAVAQRFTLSSGQIDETGLTYVGLADVTTGAGATTTMLFTLTGATMHGLDLSLDCRSSLTMRSTVTDPDTAVAGAATLYVTSLSFVLSGSPQSFTVAQPPFVGYSLPSETLTDVEMEGIRADLASITLHHLSEQPAAC